MPRTGSYYQVLGASLPGWVQGQAFALGADVPCPANSTTSILNLGFIPFDEGVYILEFDGAAHIVVGATAPTSLTFTVGNAPFAGMTVQSQVVPQGLVLNNAIILFPVTVGVRQPGVTNPAKATINFTVQVTTVGVGGTVTVKAGSTFAITAGKEQD